MTRKFLVAAALMSVAVSFATSNAAAPPKVVQIKGSAYNPSPVSVAQGDLVVWVNEDIAFTVVHTVTSCSVSGSSCAFDSDDILVAYALNTTSLARGRTYTYKCTIHPSMRGSLTINP